MKEFIINENEAGQRFDKYLGKLLREAPKSFFYKMLRKKNITLNGGRATGNEKLSTGDHVKLFLSDETFGKFAGVQEKQELYDGEYETEWEFLKEVLKKNILIMTTLSVVQYLTLKTRKCQLMSRI